MTPRSTSDSTRFPPPSVLIVDDDVDAAEALHEYLEHEGFPSQIAHSLDEAEQAMRDNSARMLLLDVRLGSEFGLDLIPRIRKTSPGALCVVMTAFADTDIAIEAVKRGAYDFLRKPVNPAELVTVLNRGYEIVRLREEAEATRRLLERSEANMRMAQQVGHFGSWEHDPLSGETYWSEEHLRMFGLPPGATPTRERFVELVHPEDRGKLFDAFARMATEQRVGVEYRIVRPDGAVRFMHSEAAVGPVEPGQTPRWYGMVHDTTERRAAEDRVRQSEERLAGILSMAVDAIISVNSNQDIILFNRGAEQIFGYSAQEVLGKPLSMLLPERYRDSHVGSVSGFQEGPSTQRYMAERSSISGLRKNGQEFPAEASISRFETNNEQTSTVILRDISARLQAEQEISRGAARLKQAMEIAQLGTFEWDLVAKRGRLSPESARIFGMEAGEGTDNTYDTAVITQRVHASDRARLTEAMQEAVNEGQPFKAEVRVMRPDGSMRHVETRGELIRDAAGKPVSIVGVVHDMTDRVELEQRLRQSQKMEAVGSLAGGIAHDFNNMLQVITGYCELTIALAGNKKDLVESVSKALKAAESASVLTRQLLTFSRRQVLQRETTDLNTLVSNQAHMLRRLIRKDIELRVEPAPTAATAEADATMVEQVIVNLAVNARDAMPDGGRLTIQVGHINADDAFCRAHAWARERRYVTVTVTDSGTGIPREIRERIFEPFFTTKETGKGTGLGLATVYGIMQQHDGMVTVYSELGLGSTFTLYFPAGGKAETETEEAPIADVKGGTETILLAEDEPAVRDVVVTILSSMGYRVLIARDGQEALVVYGNHSAEIRLALLDMIMPKLNGRRLYEQIHARNPSLPVVFSTGYAGDTEDREFLSGKGVRVVRKPYSAAELLKAVRDELDRPR